METRSSMSTSAIFAHLTWGQTLEAHVLCAWTVSAQISVPIAIPAGRRATEKWSFAKGTNSTRYLELAGINLEKESSWKMDQHCLRSLIP